MYPLLFLYLLDVMDWTRRRAEYHDIRPERLRGRGRGCGSSRRVGNSLGPFSGLGSKLAPGRLFGALCAHFLAWVPKGFQEAHLEPSRCIFWSWFGNGSRKLVWRSLHQFSGLDSEIAPGKLYGALKVVAKGQLRREAPTAWALGPSRLL